MPIIICNVSKPPTEHGVNTYEIRLNSLALGSFKHNRDDKLSVLLLKAANAVEYLERDDVVTLHNKKAEDIINQLNSLVGGYSDGGKD